MQIHLNQFNDRKLFLDAATWEDRNDIELQYRNRCSNWNAGGIQSCSETNREVSANRLDSSEMLIKHFNVAHKYETPPAVQNFVKLNALQYTNASRTLMNIFMTTTTKSPRNHNATEVYGTEHQSSHISERTCIYSLTASLDIVYSLRKSEGTTSTWSKMDCTNRESDWKLGSFCTTLKRA